MWQAIIFDGDDTLWLTERLYDDARQRARQIVERTGLDGSEWERVERRLDVANVERLGHSIERFPTSCVQAYAALCADLGRPVDPVVQMDILHAARQVFEDDAPLVPNAHRVLVSLANHGFRLGLLTKGDPQVQQRRIDRSGLRDLFDDIRVVDSKTGTEIALMVDRLGVPPAQVLSVGNSIRSDVFPSLAAGVQPIWVDAHVWEYEKDHPGLPDGVLEAHDLSDVLRLVIPTSAVA